MATGRPTVPLLENISPRPHPKVKLAPVVGKNPIWRTCFKSQLVKSRVNNRRDNIWNKKSSVRRDNTWKACGQTSHLKAVVAWRSRSDKESVIAFGRKKGAICKEIRKKSKLQEAPQKENHSTKKKIDGFLTELWKWRIQNRAEQQGGTQVPLQRGGGTGLARRISARLQNYKFWTECVM